MAGTIQIAGLKELQKKFKELSDSMQKKTATRATAAGASVMRKAVRQKALQQPTLADKPFKVDGVQVEPGFIAENIVSRKLKGSALTSEHVITVRSKSKKGVARSPYAVALFNEFGTVKMRPQPFMRPGFDESKERAAQAIVDRLKKGIDEAVSNP